MPRRPFEEPVDAWCALCGSHGKPAGEGYCEECRPVRARYLAELPSRDFGYRSRRAVYQVTGIDPGRGMLGAVALGTLLALALFLVVVGN